MKPAVINFESRSEDGDRVVSLVYENLAGPAGGDQGRVWWRVPGEPELADPPILDGLVLPLALHAAHAGQDLKVRGPMSRLGLANMDRLVEGRGGAEPARFPHRTTIEPDEVVDPVRPSGMPERAALAFSGGLDSTFTAMRHAERLRGEASRDIAALVMVHGLDAPLTDVAGFEGMVRRAEPMARRIGVPIRTVATDAMRFSATWTLWPQQATPMVAAAMSLFTDRVSVGIIGGGIPYGAGRVGLGHPPIFDQLCSNTLMRIVTDGAELGRADKIEQLLPYPSVISGIKVCIAAMAGEGDSSLNCGKCWKCVVTWMNFKALGIDRPPCFAEPVDEALISTYYPESLYMARDLAFAWEDAVSREAKGSWVDRLRWVMRRVPPDGFLLDRPRRAFQKARRLLRH